MPRQKQCPLSKVRAPNILSQTALKNVLHRHTDPGFSLSGTRGGNDDRGTDRRAQSQKQPWATFLTTVTLDTGEVLSVSRP